MTWAEKELVEIVRIVRPRDNLYHDEDAVDYAMIISAIRRLIESSRNEYLELVREAANQAV